MVLENVVGLLTLEGGRDFSAICERLREMGYCYGATIVDAKHFLPQSRPRVFIIAILKGINIPTKLFRGMASSHWHSPTLLRTYRALPSRLHEDLVLENVVGLLTLEGGRDFSAICERLREMGYCYG
ncbi:DNA cytosine methyltransferase, partial [Escherichia coli]